MKTDHVVRLSGASATILTFAFLGIAICAQSQTSDQATVIASAKKAALAAVNFRQGDGASLKRARNDFTSEGWKSFIGHMQGFLDQNGVPQFSSTFAASKEPVFLGEDNGIVHFRIPGTLTQAQGGSKTVYRAALEVYAERDPMNHGASSIKIRQLNQVTCVGTSTACQ
jgi:hypothetical protein